MGTLGYERAMHEWQSEMDAELRREDGLLAEVGIFWLKDGVNILGSSRDCDIQLPKPAPNLLGAIHMDGGEATLKIDLGVSVAVNGVAVQAPTVLRPEGEYPTSVITYQGLRMVIFRDTGRMGLRLWDSQRSRDLPPRSWFALDEKYRVLATYTPYPAPVRVELPNVAGRVEIGYVQGYVSFKLGGKSHNLDAAELDDGRLYLQFADQTNGATTYPRGRYLKTEPVLEDGQVWIDFNKAYSPPCAFKDKEPCTFAPGGNRLKVAVEAGETYKPHN